MPADAGHPGAPACPEPIVCNGSLPDCPITCASGCPADTWCSGEYCSAKKPPGAVCGAAVECSSGFCTDGVCCDTACNGACEACSAAQGAPGDGVCTLLGSSHVCRAAGSNCDREERCTGASAACPNDGFHDAGTSCGNTMTTGWGGCDAGAGCGTMGVQTRTRTDYVCAGSSATCNTVNTPETQACTRPTEGVSCGSTGYSDWTDCNYPSVCATTTTRTRVRTDPVCASGACTAMQTTETDTCNRPTENVSCGDAGYTGWSSCTWPDTCSLSGSRTRTRTDPVCQSGNCGSTMATETDTAGCDRPTNGNNCGDAGYSMWSDCDYPTACATAGLRSRSVTTYTCGSGNCNTSTNTEVDSTTCMRPTNGNNCGTTEYGDCVYASPCATTGNRQVITWVCNGSQTCVSMTSTETNAPACNRLTTGDPCDTTQYNCVYPGGTCANSGNRQVTTWTCNSSATCVSSTTTEPNSPSCARNTNGEVCDPTNCGLCINSCNCNCQNYRNCTSYTCSNQVCVGQNYQEDCGACNPGRGGCNLCKDGETR